jgi:glyoxylase I family protein
VAFVTDGAIQTHLAASGVPHSDWGNAAVIGWSQIFFFDPDGNVIEVHQVDDDAA